MSFYKESYFNLAVENCQEAERQTVTSTTVQPEQPSLFDLMEQVEAI